MVVVAVNARVRKIRRVKKLPRQNLSCCCCCCFILFLGKKEKHFHQNLPRPFKDLRFVYKESGETRGWVREYDLDET